MRKTIFITIITFIVSCKNHTINNKSENIDISNQQKIDSNSLISNDNLKGEVKNILIMGNEDEDINNELISSITYYFSKIDSTIKYIPENDLSVFENPISTNDGNIQIFKIPLTYGDKTYVFYFNEKVDQTLKLVKSDIIEFDAYILNIFSSNGLMPYSYSFLKEIGRKNTTNKNNIITYYSWCEAINAPDIHSSLKNELLNTYNKYNLDTLNPMIIYGAKSIDSIKSNHKWLEKIETIHSFIDEIK